MKKSDLSPERRQNPAKIAVRDVVRVTLCVNKEVFEAVYTPGKGVVVTKVKGIQFLLFLVVIKFQQVANYLLVRARKGWRIWSN
jgi:hypothetical protein